MKIIFELNHPKHYYQFKYIKQILEKRGHTCYVLARDKDVLLKILQEEHITYEIFGKHGKSLPSKIIGALSVLLHYYRIAKNIKPDIIVSKASLFSVIIGKLLLSKSVICPDSEIVWLTNKLVAPMADKIITPDNFAVNYGKKQSRVKGMFECSYLDSKIFIANKEVIEKYHLSPPYAVFRFVGWYANHDVNNMGLTLSEKIGLVESVAQNMNVYISSEKELPEELIQYRLNTPSSEIHNVLAFADLYVGDSQTMATEAAILGTPAIRSNSFVGVNDMSNFKILENKYKLLINIPINRFDLLQKKCMEYSEHSQKAEWQQRVSLFYENVGDINEEISNIIERTK